MDNTKLEFVNKNTKETFEIGLPQEDLEVFFAETNRYEDFLNNNYEITKFENRELAFLKLDKDTSLSKLNDALLKYDSLDDSTKETVLLVTHLSGDTLDALIYSLRNYQKYILVPEELNTNNLIVEFAIKAFTERNFLCYFLEAVDYNRFYQLLFSNGIAYKINKRILIKKSMII